MSEDKRAKESKTERRAIPKKPKRERGGPSAVADLIDEEMVED